MTSPPEYWVARDVDDAPEPSGWTRNLAAVAEVVFADADGPPPPDRIAWTVQQVRSFCERVGGKAVLVFRLALFAITWIAPLFTLSLPPLRRHDIGRRQKIVHRFENSIFGLTIFAAKAFLCMQYFEHPDVAEEVNFDGELRREQ
jgi:hypothetical protein